jgi:hypothetical protein
MSHKTKYVTDRKNITAKRKDKKGSIHKKCMLCIMEKREEP